MSTGHTSETHKKIRKLQNLNDDSFHHPEEKIQQIDKFKHLIHGNILEVFAGQGNLTKYYKTLGNTISMSKETTGNSFDYIYKLRAEKKKFQLIDIDSYGYPDKFFPVVFEMMEENTILIFTFPIVGINCLNGITEQHFINFWRSSRPTIGDITGILTDMALREWKLLSLLDVVKIKRIWRFMYQVKQLKATEITFTKNR